MALPAACGLPYGGPRSLKFCLGGAHPPGPSETGPQCLWPVPAPLSLFQRLGPGGAGREVDCVLVTWLPPPRPGRRRRGPLTPARGPCPWKWVTSWPGPPATELRPWLRLARTLAAPMGQKVRRRKGQSYSARPQDAEVQLLGLLEQVAPVPGQQPPSGAQTLERTPLKAPAAALGAR